MVNYNEFFKKAFSPAQAGGSPQGVPPGGMPPPPQEEGVPAPSPAELVPPPPPQGGEGQPSGGLDPEALNFIDKISETVDKLNNRVDSLESQLMASNSKVTELYGNINMLLSIIEKGNASGALNNPKL